MLTIKILGPGCANCERLEKLVRKVLDQLGAEADIIKITNLSEFADYDVLATPGLVINGSTVCSGRVPSMAELAGRIETAMATEQ